MLFGSRLLVGGLAVTMAVWSVCLPCESARTNKSVPPIKTSKKMVAVWKVTQSNAWGLYTIYASPQYIRVDGSTGGGLISKAPDWEISLFHKKDKRACQIAFRDWGTNRNLGSFRIDKNHQTPEKCNIAGIDARRYTFPMDDLGYGEGGATAGLFRSNTKKVEVVRRKITIASSNHNLPHQPIEVWRLMLETPTKYSIPLEIRDDVRFGGQLVHLKTQSQTNASVPVEFFDPPTGYKNEGTPITIFYGKQVEDVASMMMDMK